MQVPSSADNSATAKCIECGSAILPKAKFCVQCGATQTNNSENNPNRNRTSKGNEMTRRNVRVIWAVLVIGLVGIALVFGVQHYHHKQRLALFQTLIREGSGQAKATLSTVSMGSIYIDEEAAECVRFTKAQRDLVAKVAAADMSDAPEVQSEYIDLLNTESDLMLKMREYDDTKIPVLKTCIFKPRAQCCYVERQKEKLHISVMEQASNVFSLEQKFASTCVKNNLAFEPIFKEYEEQYFVKNNSPNTFYGCDK
jgi:uncharacterized membrane protein YvbJ